MAPKGMRGMGGAARAGSAASAARRNLGAGPASARPQGVSNVEYVPAGFQRTGVTRSLFRVWPQRHGPVNLHRVHATKDAGPSWEEWYQKMREATRWATTQKVATWALGGGGISILGYGSSVAQFVGCDPCLSIASFLVQILARRSPGSETGQGYRNGVLECSSLRPLDDYSV